MLCINHWHNNLIMENKEIHFIASSKRSDFVNGDFSHYNIVGTFFDNIFQIGDSVDCDTNAIILEPDGLPYNKIGVLMDQVCKYLQKRFNTANLCAEVNTATKFMCTGEGNNIIRFSFIIRSTNRICK